MSIQIGQTVQRMVMTSYLVLAQSHMLGYSRSEVTEVLRTIDTASLSLEGIITAALRRFSE